MPSWRFLAVAAALAAGAGYAGLSHALMVQAPAQSTTLLLLLGPLLAALALAGARRRHGPSLAGAALLAAVLAAVALAGAADDASRLYVAQHAGIHLALAWSFGITLRPGSTPLITRIGERVHRRFPEPMRAYTRRLTGWWTAYFAAMALLSVALYAAAPWSWWSVFCNLVTPLAAAAFFAAEVAWRRWRHPDFEPVVISEALRAYRRGARAGER